MEIGIALGLAAAAVAILFAVLVFGAARRIPLGRSLAALLLTEGLFVLAFSVSDLIQGTWSENLVVIAFSFGLALCALYPLILRELTTPFTRWFRRPLFLRVWIGLYALDAVLLPSIFFSLAILGRRVADDSPIVFLALPAFIGIFFLSIIGFVAAVWAFNHAEAGPKKERARAFVIAFGFRDIMYAISIASNFGSDLVPPGVYRELSLDVSAALSSLGTLVFVPVLAYGILSTQLFDIDLKIKLGIKRGTVVGLILGAFFAVAKITEAYLSREVGFVAGSIIAGLMLFAVPKLNKVGEKVANKAMPTVQATPVYVQFKKLEVYRAAVESAHETGGITPKERASLDRLRTKLGILEEDATLVESEILGASPTVSGVPNAVS